MVEWHVLVFQTNGLERTADVLDSTGRRLGSAMDRNPELSRSPVRADFFLENVVDPAHVEVR
jgi:hypothetical protein